MSVLSVKNIASEASENLDFQIDGEEIGKPLVISFSFAFWDKSCDFDFVGRLKKVKLLLGQPFNTIYLRDPKSMWYQAGVAGLGDSIDEVVESLSTIIERIRPSEIITIGQSMGGYAALVFGRLLNANKIIAFAPLSFLDPEGLRTFGDSRYYSGLKKIETLGSNKKYLDVIPLFDDVDSTVEIHVLFGTRVSANEEVTHLDAMHALRLKAIPMARMHSYDGADHLIVKYLSDSSQMDGVLLKLLFGKSVNEKTLEPIEYGWYKWIFDQVLSGFSAELLIDEINKSGEKNKKAVIEELKAANSHPYIRAAKEMKLSIDKRNWLLDTCDKLSALDPRYSTKIEKRAVPPFDEFVRNYYSKHMPAVFTGGFDHWPAKHTWCPDYFAELVGNKQVEVQFNRSQDRHYERNSRKYKQKMRMDEFCRLVVEDGESNDYYLTANNNQASLSELALLFEDVGDFGKGYRIPETIKTRSHLWFGPKGAFTPLHHDLTNNMLVQIYGRKKLTLIPAFQVPHLYNDTHVYSATDFPVIDLKRFPKMKNVTPIKVVLHPGEAVFIPIGWWHCVESLDVSISVSFTDFNVRNDFFVYFPRGA